MAVTGPVPLAEFVLDQLGVRDGERVAVIADEGRGPSARDVVLAARQRGAQATLVVDHTAWRDLDHVPARVAEAVAAADVAVLLVDQWRTQLGGHAAFRKDAVARGARVGFVPRHVEAVDPAALAEVAATTERIAARLSAADRALVTSDAGSRLEVDLAGRAARALHHQLAEPGAWGALPDFFEAAIAPVEGHGGGQAVIDGTCLVTGVADPPMRLEVADGRVARLAGGRSDDLRRYLTEAGAGADTLAELGIGTSHLQSPAELTGGFVDKRVAGTAHLGLGDNRGLGGTAAASIHTDVQLLGVTVLLDGTDLLVDAGMLRG